jgi:hypothetical protein
MTVMDNEDPALPEAEIDECEAVIACLGDDAALLRHDNPHCEIAANMDAAADMLEKMRRALHDVAEEWAGAECGEPVHAQEAYAIGLAKRMYALAVDGLRPNAELTRR